MKLTFNNQSTLFKCDPSLFLTMEYFKITDNNSLRKLLILETPQNMRFYIMIIWNPTILAQIKTTIDKVIPALIWMSTMQRSKKNKAYPSKNK